MQAPGGVHPTLTFDALSRTREDALAQLRSHFLAMQLAIFISLPVERLVSIEELLGKRKPDFTNSVSKSSRGLQ